MARNKQACMLNAFLFSCVSFLVYADGRIDMDIRLIRERLHKLETRSVEDLELLRKELYHVLDNVSKHNVKNGVRVTSTMTPNIGSQGIKSEIVNIKQELLNKLNLLRDGLTDEKRIRRSIQSDIQSLRDNDTTNLQLLLNGCQNLSNILNVLPVLEKLQRDVEALANTVETNFRNKESRVSDCTEWLRLGHTVSGVYTVNPQSMWRPLNVYCDMETDGGGWTVFQRRMDGTENFYRNWMNYTFGFGNLSGEFWLGNEFVHHLTSNGPNELRIDMEDFENNSRVAKYGLFSVGPRSGGFVLNVDFFNGNIDDSLIATHQNQQFSTYDIGPSIGCSKSYKGGWWYNKCHGVNLNGLYHIGKHESYADGINWSAWKGHHYSLKKTEMKLRPR